MDVLIDTVEAAASKYKGPDGMSPKSFEAMIRTGYDAWNRGDFDASLEGLDPEIEWRAHFPGVDEAIVYHGHDGVKRFWAEFDEAWEQISIEPERFVERNDQVLVLLRFFATGRGSGVAVSRRSAHLFTFRDGQVVRFDGYMDTAEALDAVGLEQ